MMPKQNSRVKIFFKNSVSIEGFVQAWSREDIRLLSLDRKSIFVCVCHEDIMGYKIFLEEEAEDVPVAPNSSVVQQHTVQLGATLQKQRAATQQTFEEAKAAPASKTRLQKLAELRKELAQQEREIITNKLTDHTPGQVKLPSYGLPGFSKK